MEFSFVIKTSVMLLLIFSNSALYSQTARDTLIAYRYYKKADSLLINKKIDSSIVYFKKALAIYQTNVQWEKVASCYNSVAEVKVTS